MQRLILPAAVRAQIFAHARETPTQECCGLLVGEGEQVTSIVPSPNVASQPEQRFEIDPQVQFSTMRRLRGTRQRIAGHYHSHPQGCTTPSQHDLAMAHDPEAVWVIVTLAPTETAQAFRCLSQDRGFVTIPMLT